MRDQGQARAGFIALVAGVMILLGLLVYPFHVEKHLTPHRTAVEPFPTPTPSVVLPTLKPTPVPTIVVTTKVIIIQEQPRAEVTSTRTRKTTRPSPTQTPKPSPTPSPMKTCLANQVLGPTGVCLPKLQRLRFGSRVHGKFFA